ncbi:hypothetical protein ACWD7T_22375, partial [Streptomyces sp. 900116325]
VPADGVDLVAEVETGQLVGDPAAVGVVFGSLLDAQRFTRLLAWSEIAVGGTLLAPFVPTRLAGVALTGFSAGLIGLYLRVPGMRESGSLRPTQAGIPLAKDFWMLGMGIGFLGARSPRRGASANRCPWHRCGHR